MERPSSQKLNLPTSDVAFDPNSNNLYASIPGRAGRLGNRVVAIDPASGAIEGSVFVGSEPGKLALSQDGQYLYVALTWIRTSRACVPLSAASAVALVQTA